MSKEGFKRPKRSNLDIFDFELILRDIAFETSKIGKVIYSKDEIINYISNAKSKNIRIEFKEQSFYEDLTTTVPIFTKEGFLIKWAHKSFQDFFSAKYISNHNRKEEILEVIYKSGKYSYLNILDLLYELEYPLFRKKIIKPILEDFVEYYVNQYVKKPEGIAQIHIDERIALAFGNRLCFLKTGTEIGFEKARNMFIEKVEAQDSKFRIGATCHHSALIYYTMNELSLQKQILKILKIKNEDLFLNENRSYVKLSDDRLGKFNLNEPYIIDDNLKEPFNSPDIFIEITQEFNERMVSFEERDLRYNLDYNKCKKKLDLIKKEIEQEESIDFLSDI